MEIRQFRVVLKARDFDRTCSFYGETLALPPVLAVFDQMSLVLHVPSAEKAYEELIFRNRNIPGGLATDTDGAMTFGTHDPDGVKVVFRQTD